MSACASQEVKGKQKNQRNTFRPRNEISGVCVGCETMMPSRMEEVLIENLTSLNSFAVFLFPATSRLNELNCEDLIFNLTSHTVVVSIVSHEWVRYSSCHICA